MADNIVTVVTGVNEDVRTAAASLDTALSDIDSAKTVFLCDIYQQGNKWFHVLVHQT